MSFTAVEALRWWLSSPVWVAGGALSFFSLGLWGLLPLDMEAIREPGTGDWILTRIRRIAIAVALFLFLPIPWIFGWMYCGQFPDAAGGGICSPVWGWVRSLAFEGIFLALSAWVSGWIIGWLWERTASTWISHFGRKLRFKVSDESLSDIREVAGRMKTRGYDPRTHYRLEAGSLFLGLNGAGERVMLPLSDFEGRHMEVIGPTGFGKGVVVGVLLDQIVRLGSIEGKPNIVIAIMPKQDLWLPHVLERAAQAVGAEFLFFDMLKKEAGGGWNPLASGGPSEKRSRIMSLLGMGETGSDADFYKLGEKEALDGILEEGKPGTLTQLYKAVAKKVKDESEDKGGRPPLRAMSALGEIHRIETFKVSAEEAGLDVVDLLSSRKPRVLYVNSSLTNDTALKMTKALLLEITQQSISLSAQRKRSNRVWLFMDELRYLVSEQFDKALATVGMYDVHMIGAYQSPSDMEKPDDRTLNGQALAHSVHTNMQLKLIYRVGMGDQARWVAEQTGTKYLSVTSGESAEVGRFGAEKWAGERRIDRKEEYFVSENELKSLPKRCGVLIAPNRLAQVVFTAHVPVEAKSDFYREEDSGKKAKPKKVLPRKAAVSISGDGAGKPSPDEVSAAGPGKPAPSSNSDGGLNGDGKPAADGKDSAGGGFNQSRSWGKSRESRRNKRNGGRDSRPRAAQSEAAREREASRVLAAQLEAAEREALD